MSVYVDKLKDYQGHLWCHMVADTHAELVAMARFIGLRDEWIQKPGRPDEHYDLSPSKRAAAIQNGAVDADWRTVGRIIRGKR